MVTPVQQKIYEYIQDHIGEHGYSPSLSEVARGIGISPKSISLVSRSIHALVDAGRLKFDKKGYRKVQVAAGGSLTLPLMGRIAAGTPIEAIEDRQNVDLGSLLGGQDHFVLEVRGESMVDEGIFDGDLVICRHASDAREGDIVVALIDNLEATLKRISYQISDRITLIPANAALKPKAYLSHRVQIQGVFVGLLRLRK
jgi:repressor LexA